MKTKDYLFERQKILRHQRRLYFFFGITIVLIFFSLFTTKPINIGKLQSSSTEKTGYIGRIYLRGEISSNAELTNKIAEIAKNEDVSALLVYINSSGGTVNGSETLFNALATVSAVKPVVSIVEDVAASGGYMAALASHCIFASNTSVVGSIGTITQFFEVTELAKKLGVEFGVIKSSPLKATPNPFEKVTAPMIEARKFIADDVFYFFKQLVQERRSMTEAQLAKVVDARVFTGRQAVALNLVDAIGQEAEAVEWLVEVRGVPKNLEVVDYELFKKPKRRFIDSIGLMHQNLESFITMIESRFGTTRNLPQLRADF